MVGIAWSGVQGRIGAVQALAGWVVAGVVDGGSVTDSWDTSGVEATAAGWLNSGSGGASTEHIGSSLQLSSTAGVLHCNDIKRGSGFRGQAYLDYDFSGSDRVIVELVSA